MIRFNTHMSRTIHIVYLLCLLGGAIFVLLYKGPGADFVRGYGGDWLIVQVIYLVARFWVQVRWRLHLAAVVFIFAVGVEIFQLVFAGAIPRNVATELTVGSTFDLGDIVAYGLGLIMVLVLDRTAEWR
jgi:hypothetical protein